MTSFATQVQPAEGAPPGSGVASGPPLVHLHLDFGSNGAARKYVTALASLLHGTVESCVVVESSGRGRDDLDLREINQRITAAATLNLQVLVRIDGGLQTIAIELDAAAASIGTRIPLDTRPASTIWLQAHPEQYGPIPVLALPVNGTHFTVDALHPLVGLGVRTAGLLGAQLHIEGESAARFGWTVDGKSNDALPVVASQDAAVWTPNAGALAETTPELWFEPGPAPPAFVTISEKWWTRFDDLTRSAATSVAELESHLRDLVPDIQDWRLDDAAVARHADFMVPVEDGSVMALVTARGHPAVRNTA